MNGEVLVAINQAFHFLPLRMDSLKARVQMYAIGFQESDFAVRRQYNNGPAASFWQFEKGGGIKGVLTHPASKDYAAALCTFRQVEPTRDAVWNAMLTDDVIGAGFARLLLYTDPRALPEVKSEIKLDRPTDSESWQYYSRNWRPGKPHPNKWFASRQKAFAVLGIDE